MKQKGKFPAQTDPSWPGYPLLSVTDNLLAILTLGKSELTNHVTFQASQPNIRFSFNIERHNKTEALELMQPAEAECMQYGRDTEREGMEGKCSKGHRETLE
jgi:hypothetical protein